jgi:hypothetical protein
MQYDIEISYLVFITYFPKDIGSILLILNDSFVRCEESNKGVN